MWLRVSLVLLYSAIGDVVRCVYVDPSVCWTSWVNVYGRRGRRMMVAAREGVWESGV